MLGDLAEINNILRPSGDRGSPIALIKLDLSHKGMWGNTGVGVCSHTKLQSKIATWAGSRE
jgi:7-keto-8-aminopelargonate synthetase-like enzyme